MEPDMQPIDFDETHVLVPADNGRKNVNLLLPRDYVEDVGVEHARFVALSRYMGPEHPDYGYNWPMSPQEAAVEALVIRMAHDHRKAAERRQTASHAARQHRRAHKAKDQALAFAAEIRAKNPNLGPNAISERVVTRLAEAGWAGKNLPTPRAVRMWIAAPGG